MSAELATRIKDLAARTGYVAAGIAAAAPFEAFERAVREHMARFPAAAALYARLLGRVDPRASNPWAKSILTCVRWYGKYRLPPGLAGHIGRHYLFDSRHADCPDHGMPAKMTEGLRALGLRVRRGGVPERWAGARCGVVRFGRNCFAFSDRGSWINLESWLLDAELPPDAPTPGCACPEGCRACLDACPTGALCEPFVMRMDRCVAYLTYGAPEPVGDELWGEMGPWVYGCDACQEACPLNRGAWQETERAAWLEEAAPLLAPEALAAMDDATYRRLVHPHFWYIPKDGVDRWRRNARRALDHARRTRGC
jgi:epoxyqueuosine reductase